MAFFGNCANFVSAKEFSFAAGTRTGTSSDGNNLIHISLFDGTWQMAGTEQSKNYKYRIEAIEVQE